MEGFKVKSAAKEPLLLLASGSDGITPKAASEPGPNLPSTRRERSTRAHIPPAGTGETPGRGPTAPWGGHTRQGNTKDQERYRTSLRRKSNRQRTTVSPGHSNSRTTEETRLLRPFEAAQEHAPGRGDQSGDPIPPSRNVPHRSRADCQGLLIMETDTLSMRGGQADQVT